MGLTPKFKSISNVFPNEEMPVADEAWRDLIMVWSAAGHKS